VKKKTRSAGSPGQAGLPNGWADAGRRARRRARRRATISFISPFIGGLWNILYI
jgi:hypothetical protein